MRIHRRHCLQTMAGLGVSTFSLSGWMPLIAEQLAGHSKRRRHCILLWMAGGPSQMDTFDLKPRHENGGEFKEIATSVPGLRISEHLPKLADFTDHLAIVRSLSTKEGDHGRGTHLMRTGHPPTGPVQYPTIGASISKELAIDRDELPSFVSIGPFRPVSRESFGPGFLGPKYAPLTVAASDSGGTEPTPEGGFADLRVENLQGSGDMKMARQKGASETLEPPAGLVSRKPHVRLGTCARYGLPAGDAFNEQRRGKGV